MWVSVALFSPEMNLLFFAGPCCSVVRLLLAISNLFPPIAKHVYQLAGKTSHLVVEIQSNLGKIR
jgi:hypothetical protein